MNFKPTCAALLSLALCAPLPAVAEPPPAEAPPWYQIEVFIFAQRDDNLMAEFWDERVTAALPDNALPLLGEDETPPTPPLQPPSPEQPAEAAGVAEDGIDDGEISPPPVDPAVYDNGAFRRLEGEALQLPVSNPRFANRGYRPLFHAAWRQPVEDRPQARPVRVTSAELLADGEPALSGIVEVSLSRYLHLKTDLYLRVNPPLGWVSMRPQRQEETETETARLLQPANTNNIGLNPAYTPSALVAPTPQVLTLRLEQSRRMRSEELHYIDHPLLGVLVRITPYELPSPEPEPLLPGTPPAQPAAARTQ